MGGWVSVAAYCRRGWINQDQDHCINIPSTAGKQPYMCVATKRSMVQIVVLLLTSFIVSFEAAGLQVIGAGLGRTGTTSLKRALNELGFKTYHMDESRKSGHGGLNGLWDTVAQAELSGTVQSKQAARDLLASTFEAEGWTATVDYPACLLYDDHVHRFPNAKVILSVRDTPEKWAKSMSDSILNMVVNMWRPPLSFVMPHMKSVGTWMFSTHGFLKNCKGSAASEDRCVARKMPSQSALAQAYQEWLEQVKVKVPKERLLVHNAKDGWKPLCTFLEIANCPTIPYPRSNDSAAFKSRLPMFIFFIENFWLISAGLTVFAAFALVTLIRRCCSFRAGKQTTNTKSD